MMYSIEELKKLNKNPEVNLRYCEFITDKENKEENIRCRILKDNEKYYFHEMKNGEVINCYEIALRWKQEDDRYIFSYTPDDLHVMDIDSKNPFTHYHEVFNLKDEQIEKGMKCTCKGLTVEFVNDECLLINDKAVKVQADHEYTYKIMKTKIKAINGAKGLFEFLENISENYNRKLYSIVFISVIDLFNKQYPKVI